MGESPFSDITHTAFWGVLKLFVIPVGGGIPAGVLLARDHGLGWIATTGIYLVSDVLLACVFEPAILLIFTVARLSKRATRFTENFAKAMKKTAARYAKNPRPLSLILVSFGVDPMTGRTAAILAGHGFITGWMLAIAGDMIYFGILMISTLWLDGILGDGTWTTLIVLAGMFGVPWIYRKLRRSAVAPAVPE